MAEPYFKDPLLAKWAEGCHGSVLTEIERIWRSQETRGQLDPLHVYSGLEQSLRSGHCEAPASVKKASERLRSLVLAELSGARRARERADLIAGSAGMGEHGMIRHDVATQILEAFDGE